MTRRTVLPLFGLFVLTATSVTLLLRLRLPTLQDVGFACPLGMDLTAEFECAEPIFSWPAAILGGIAVGVVVTAAVALAIIGLWRRGGRLRVRRRSVHG